MSHLQDFTKRRVLTCTKTLYNTAFLPSDTSSTMMMPSSLTHKVARPLPASFDLSGEQGVDPGLVNVAVAQVVGVLLPHPKVLLHRNGHAGLPLSSPQTAAVTPLYTWYTHTNLDFIET